MIYALLTNKLSRAQKEIAKGLLKENLFVLQGKKIKKNVAGNAKNLLLQLLAL